VLKEARAAETLRHWPRNIPRTRLRREGGDLGWALRGAYVQAFSDRLFAMKAGEISEPVKTQFGYHIIKLEEVQPQRAKTLSDARSQIEGDYRRSGPRMSLATAGAAAAKARILGRRDLSALARNLA